MWEWVNTNLANVRCTHNRWFGVDQILPAVIYAFPQKKTQVILHVRFVHIRCQYRTSQIFFQKPSQINKIVLKQVEENAKTK